MITSDENAADAEYAAFEADAPAVEVGKSEPEAPAKETPKPAGHKGPKEPAKAPAEAEKPAEEIETSQDNEEENEGGEENEDDTAKKGEGQIKRLKRERMQAKAENRELRERLARLEGGDISERIARLEKGGLPNSNGAGNSALDIGKMPDSNDSDKYPLGHLDDRYIEDKLEWLATEKAAKQADAVLQRQQENEQNAALNQQREELLGKVDDLATRGADVSDDFQEAVVEAGMRGEWKLSQPTFEAAHEAEHGAQILYELSQDKKEAERVSKLSPYGQTKFVMDRDNALSTEGKPRRIPGAGAPPQTQTRGANSRTQINPATDNLDDFSKLFEAGAKGRN